MNLKKQTIFVVLSFSVAALIMTAYTHTIQSVFVTTFAQENQTGNLNEAEVNADIEQENKCKKDTECENENELNNSLKILNKETGQTGNGQLTVTKIVTCEFVITGGSTKTVFNEQPVLTNIQYIPVGDPCLNSEIAAQFEPQDFEFTVTGNNPNPSQFPGSDSGVFVTLGAGAYDVQETNNIPSNIGPYTINIETTESGDCSGTINAGDSKSCTFTNAVTLRLPQQP